MFHLSPNLIYLLNQLRLYTRTNFLNLQDILQFYLVALKNLYRNKFFGEFIVYYLTIKTVIILIQLCIYQIVDLTQKMTPSPKMNKNKIIVLL